MMDYLASPLAEPGSVRCVGTLADELDSLDDYWEDGVEPTPSRQGTVDTSAIQTPGDETMASAQIKTGDTRDSGVDVGYSPSPSHVKFLQLQAKAQSTHVKTLSKHIKHGSRTQSELDFEPELEEVIDELAQLALGSDRSQTDTISGTIALLQNLHGQTTLENCVQSYAAACSNASKLMAQRSRVLATVSAGVYGSSPSRMPQDQDTEDILTMLTSLSNSQPRPDTQILQTLSTLNRQTTHLSQTFCDVLDSLQMSRQTSSLAARHLRSTRAMTSDIRRELERSDRAQHWLDNGDWDKKLGSRWCAMQCKDVVSGFERVCNDLRRGLEQGMMA